MMIVNSFRWATSLILLLVSLFALTGAGTADVQAFPDQKDQPFTCNNVTEIPDVECAALVALYRSTNGSEWRDNSGWLSENSPCAWAGVNCTNGRVDQLFLEGNQLTGFLPAEVGDLTALTWLQLNNNQLTGSIPATLGNLTAVTWLRLEDNQLSGPIPPTLGNMSMLENLYLAGNPLSGTIPAELGNLANLRKLYLDTTDLQGTIPVELGNLAQLEYLILSNSALHGPLPPSLPNLTNLTYFHFLETALCEPRDSIFQLWLQGIEFLYSPAIPCDDGPTTTPTITPTTNTTATATPIIATPTTESNVGTGLCRDLVVDRDPHPMTLLDKPNHLQAITDPAFGTTIRRITDIEATVTGAQAVIKPMYNTVQAWNADESRLLLYQRGVGHQLFDGITYQYIRNLDIFPADLEEVFWDFDDPTILYYVEPYAINAENPGQRLIRYNVITDTQEVVRSFANICGADSVEGGNDIQMMSWDSDVIGLRCTSEPEALLFGYRMSSDTVTPIISSAQSERFDPWTAPQAAPSGERFFLNDTVLDWNMNIVQTLNMESPEHATLGQFRDGTDGLFTVAFAEGPAGRCGPGSLIAHNLTTGSCRTLVGEETGYPYPPSDTHMAALSHQNPGWIAVSGIGVANWGQTDEAGQEVLDNELLLVDSAPGGQVCRVGHHRSFGDGGEFGYWSEPHVVISPSGTRLLFGSDWQGGSSVDTYVVELDGFASDGPTVPQPSATPSPSPSPSPSPLPSPTPISTPTPTATNGTISGQVFEDANENGNYDAGEPVLDGIIIILIDISTQGQTLTVSTQTDDQGIYRFSNLPDANYRLTFVLPTGYVPSSTLTNRLKGSNVGAIDAPYQKQQEIFLPLITNSR